jgi:hypothetical protein
MVSALASSEAQVDRIKQTTNTMVEETGEPEKTIDLSQVTDKLHHIMLYT